MVLSGIIMDVTEQVTALQQIQELNEEEIVINEELRVSNEELLETQQELWQTNQDLAASQTKLNQIIKQLPAPVVLLSGTNQVIETANEALLSLLNKQPAEVIGMPLEVVFPELEHQPSAALWKQVLKTGEIISGREKPVAFDGAGGKRLHYIDYYYQPLKDAGGNINGVLATIIDNTDKVVARKTIEESEEKLKLAVETGKMGTWSIALDSMKLTMSAFVKDILGLPPDGEPDMEAVMQAIDPEYRPMLAEVLSNAIRHQQSSDSQYLIRHLQTGEQKWVRATGKVFTNVAGQPAEYAGIFMDITEQKQDEQRKSDFINMVSHELKTPLTSVSGYVQLLQKIATQAGDTFTATLLDKTYRQVKKMTTMINGFLNISRLQSGKIQIDKQRFDMAALVTEIEEETRLGISTHDIVFAPVDPTFVCADRDKIGHIITNFISNAVKYAAVGTTIRVACVATGGMAQVSVADEGIGIHPEDLDRIFERYYRVQNKTTNLIAGFGIGLYLCTEIIRRHHGKIWAESIFGKGSTFYCSIPLDVNDSIPLS